MKKVLRWIQFNHPNIARANYEVFDDANESLGGKDIDLSNDSSNKLKALFAEIAKELGVEVPEEESK